MFRRTSRCRTSAQLPSGDSSELEGKAQTSLSTQPAPGTPDCAATARSASSTPLSQRAKTSPAAAQLPFGHPAGKQGRNARRRCAIARARSATSAEHSRCVTADTGTQCYLFPGQTIEQIYDSMLDSLSENIEFFKVPVRFDRLTPDAKFALKEYEDWAKKLPGLCRVSRSSRPSQARRPRTSGCATPGSAQRWGVMDGVPVAAACLPKRALSGSGKGAAAQAAGDVHVCERPVRKSAGRERRRLRARLVFLRPLSLTVQRRRSQPRACASAPPTQAQAPWWTCGIACACSSSLGAACSNTTQCTRPSRRASSSRS